MIIQYRALLPEPIRLVAGDTLPPFEMEFRGQKIRVYPPMKAAISLAQLNTGVQSLENISNLIVPIEPVPDDQVLFNDLQTYEANLIQLEISAGEVDRRVEVLTTTTIPPLANMFFEVLNDLIGRIRAINQTYFLRPLTQAQLNWVINILNDDRSELPKEPGKNRGAFKRITQLKAAVIRSEAWKQIETLPSELVTRPWQMLILDARAILPESGPAIVLASTALETFIYYVLDQLAKEVQPPIPVDLWKWMTQRKDHYQNPSTEDQFGTLLKIVSGKSLKDEQGLWDAFLNIRKARNKFSHEGRASVAGNLISSDQAADLVAKAEAIIDWGEQLLPERLRRVKMPNGQFKFNVLVERKGSLQEPPRRQQA